VRCTTATEPVSAWSTLLSPSSLFARRFSDRDSSPANALTGGGCQGAVDQDDGGDSAGNGGEAGGSSTSGEAGAAPGGGDVAGGRAEAGAATGGGDASAAGGEDGSAGVADAGVGDGGGDGVLVTDPQDDAAYIFQEGVVRTYEVTLAEEDLAQVNANPAAEQYVPARLHFEGQTYDRYKGSAGAFVPPCTGADNYKTAPKAGKCSVKLSFNWTDPEGRFFGMKKLQLHAMIADASFLRERLGYSLVRDMGVPASRVVHARLVVNGLPEGLFALVEEIDGRFTPARFPDGGEGNLYKEIWPIWPDPDVYLSALETNEDENPSIDKMIRFKDAVLTEPEAMASWLDRDVMLRYLAVARVIMNDDGIFHFWCAEGAAGNNPESPANHNYFWYEAPDTDRMWLIPWDLDHALNEDYRVAGFARIHVEFDWTQPAPSCGCTSTMQAPAACDPLIQNLRTWVDDYEERVDAFIAGPFSASNVDSKLAAWEAEIDPVVTETAGQNQAPSYDEWRQGTADLRGIIERARKNRGFPY
jgi:spore coat protein H